ncbi:MAG: hypothetical protein HXY48_08135 [Ignavibacteriaceae bacterium]|nr:hypothetical protein [Ignavibacteriaceae bacterium]
MNYIFHKFEKRINSFWLMLNLKIISLLLLFLAVSENIFGQTDSIEVYLIDAYCTREAPYIFKLSFYTSDVCKSKVILEDKYEFGVSYEPTDLHKTDIALSNLPLKDNLVNFVIITENESGVTNKSEVFDFDLPFEPQIKEGSDWITLCLFGSSIFLIPYPSYAAESQQSYFSLTKEIPIISFRSKSLNYPSAYLSFEYSYIFNAENPGYLRAGYKRIFEIPGLKYISPGITLYSNFNTNQGISPEFSIGLLTIKDTFTMYVRCRSNFTFHSSGTNFQEIYIGFYSGLFSLYLD